MTRPLCEYDAIASTRTTTQHINKELLCVVYISLTNTCELFSSTIANILSIESQWGYLSIFSLTEVQLK